MRQLYALAIATTFFSVGCKTLNQPQPQSEAKDAVLSLDGTTHLLWKVRDRTRSERFLACLGTCNGNPLTESDAGKRQAMCAESGRYVEWDAFKTQVVADESTRQLLVAAAENASPIKVGNAANDMAEAAMQLGAFFDAKGTEGFPCITNEVLQKIYKRQESAITYLCKEKPVITSFNTQFGQETVSLNRKSSCIAMWNGWFTDNQWFECKTQNDALAACQKWALQQEKNPQWCQFKSCVDRSGPYPLQTSVKNAGLIMYEQAYYNWWDHTNGQYVGPLGEHPICFSGDTKITMADGSKKMISSIVAGDMVLAYDAASLEVTAAAVEALIRNVGQGADILYVTFENGLVLKVTPEHPVFDAADSVWKPIGTFAVGDQVLSLDIDKSQLSLAIVGIEKQVSSEPVYNLRVKGPSTYFAEGILVHNY